jgi:MFS family permease
MGMFGSVFGIASVIGPLLGGVFTTNLTWRWCFYINLPFGGLAAAIILCFLDITGREMTTTSNKVKLAQLDFYGTALIVPGTVCLILALQWGGLAYAVSLCLSKFDVTKNTKMSYSGMIPGSLCCLSSQVYYCSDLS